MDEDLPVAARVTDHDPRITGLHTAVEPLVIHEPARAIESGVDFLRVVEQLDVCASRAHSRPRQRAADARVERVRRGATPLR